MSPLSFTGENFLWLLLLFNGEGVGVMAH
jgi:hypothetical protein